MAPLSCHSCHLFVDDELLFVVGKSGVLSQLANDDKTETPELIPGTDARNHNALSCAVAEI